MSDALPRKVVVGTAMYAMWGEYPGVEKRLEALGEIIDQMAGRAAERYPGSKLDLAVLPEDAICGGRNGAAAERSVSLEGPVLEKMAAKARQHRCYLVVPLFMLENQEKSLCTNAAALLDRAGNVAGAISGSIPPRPAASATSPPRPCWRSVIPTVPTSWATCFRAPSVRPITAIHYLFKGQPVQAWHVVG